MEAIETKLQLHRRQALVTIEARRAGQHHSMFDKESLNRRSCDGYKSTDQSSKRVIASAYGVANLYRTVQERMDQSLSIS